MIKVVCPRCKSEEIDYIDSNHQELLFDERQGYTDGIYRCSKCHIDFGTWTDFNIEITRHVVEWVEDWD